MKHFLQSLIVGLIFIPVYGAAQVGFNKVGYINRADSYSCNSVVIDNNNKIIVVGKSLTEDGVIERYNQDGTLDTTFNAGSINGGPGYINQEGNTDSNSYYSVVIDNNNKIVTVGQTDEIANDLNGLIVRYNSNGTIDTTFNPGFGYINADLPTSSLAYNSVVIDKNNKILVVGHTNEAGGFTDGLIVRYNENGSLDTTFNAPNGFINTENGTNSNTFSAVAIDRNNRIIVVGATDNPGNVGDGLIARYNENGSLDITFNNGLGYINANLPIASYYFSSVVIDNNNKIIVVGQTDDSNGLIARYNENGTLDTTFNAGSINGGPGYINQEGNTDSSVYYSVVIDNNNKIVTVGVAHDGNGLIARYNQDGTLDTTFNGGLGYINQGGDTDLWGYYSVVIDNNNKIVTVGLTDFFHGVITRHLSNGVLDTEANWNSKNYRESAHINNTQIGMLSASR